jgi:hypothetical protein
VYVISLICQFICELIRFTYFLPGRPTPRIKFVEITPHATEINFACKVTSHRINLPMDLGLIYISSF